MRYARILPLAVTLVTSPLFAQTCGPVTIRAQMVDPSDMPMPSQKVKIVLTNQSSKPIIREGFTLYFKQSNPASQDRFGTETRVEVGARQEAALVEASSDTSPIAYIGFDSVKYADGSSWRPSADTDCRVVPEALKN
jgi:hypothetical protein